MDNKTIQIENTKSEKKVDLIQLDDYITYLEHISANLRCLKYSMSKSIHQKGLHIIDVALDDTLRNIREIL